MVYPLKIGRRNKVLQTENVGYDEFLAKKIAKGRETIKMVAESHKEIEVLLVAKERELHAFENELTNG